MTEDKDLQEKYVELQLLDNQMKAVQKHIEKFDEQIAEVLQVRNSLEQLKSVNEGEEALVPIANGIFARAKLTNLGELHVNVGSNVIVTKNIEETKELLGKQSEEIAAIRTNIAAQLEKLGTKTQELQQELLRLIEKKNV